MPFRLKIRSKILLLLLGVSLLSLLIFAYTVNRDMKVLGNDAVSCIKNLGGSAAGDSEKALEGQMRQNLLVMAKDQADISNNVFRRVESEVSGMAQYATILWGNPQGLITNMAQIIKSTLANDSNLYNVYLGTQTGINVAKNGWDGFDSRERPWYVDARRTGKTGWTDTYEDPFVHSLMVTCYRPCYDAKGQFMGVIGADVTLKDINEKIINTQVGNRGYACLIDGKGNVISSGSKEWEEANGAELKKVTGDMMAGKTGVVMCKLKGGDKFIAYAPVTSTSWSLAVVLPVEDVVKPMKEMRNEILNSTSEEGRTINSSISSVNKQFLGIFIGTILIIALLSIILSNGMTRPIMALCKGAEVIGGGNLEYTIDVKTGDEIESLSNAFNKMTGDLKEYISDLEKTTAEKERIESELKVAHAIQISMLPRIFPAFPDREEFSLFATMEPAKEVGGDFYDFFLIDKDKLCFVIADVSGKGVPAALFMVIAKTLLKNQAQQGLPPEEILSTVNETLCKDNDECMFVTVFLAILDIGTGRMVFSNAGHNPPLLCRNNGGYAWLDTRKGFVLAGMENMKYKSGELVLAPGDTVFLYTDGVTEAMDPEGKLYSDARLKEVLNAIESRNEREIIKHIREDIREHVKDAAQSDDITMLVVKYNGPANLQEKG